MKSYVRAGLCALTGTAAALALIVYGDLALGGACLITAVLVYAEEVTR